MQIDDPVFPPLIKGIPVSKGDNPMDIGFALASAGKAGAGDLIWSRDTDTASLAIILEPEGSAQDALSMLPLAMVALGDCIGAIGPPNLPITFDWPKTVLANGAVVGSVDIRFPSSTKSSDNPVFMVLSLQIDITWNSNSHLADSRLQIDPGKNLMRTVLHEEGAGELDRTMIIESWARHFTAWIDTWEHDGFKAIHENWLFKAHKRNELMSVETPNGTQEGILIGMDEQGGVLLKNNGTTRLISLKDIWFEPEAKRVLQ